MNLLSHPVYCFFATVLATAGLAQEAFKPTVSRPARIFYIALGIGALIALGLNSTLFVRVSTEAAHG